MRAPCALATAIALLACHGDHAAVPPLADAAATPQVAVDSLTSAAVVRSANQTIVAELARRWEGAWVVSHADYPGSRQAWNVHGDSVTVHDAVNGWDAEEQFSLRSPCSLVRVRSIANGNVLTVVDTFVLADDGLHIALPPVAGGVRRDDMFTVCAKDRVYTFDARTNRCVEWDPAMNGVSGTQRDSCGIDRGVVVDTFTIRPLGGGVPIRMDIRGGALLSPTLTGQVAEPQPSFEDAVRRADEIVKQGESQGRAQ